MMNTDMIPKHTATATFPCFERLLKFWSMFEHIYDSQRIDFKSRKKISSNNRNVVDFKSSKGYMAGRISNPN